MKPPCGAVFTGRSALRRDHPSEPIESRNDAEAMARQVSVSLIPRADGLGSARLTKGGARRRVRRASRLETRQVEAKGEARRG
jgi:hypothetical protein